MRGAEGMGERILPHRRRTRSVPGWRIVRPCRCNVGVHPVGLVDGVGVEESFAEQAEVTEVTVCDQHIVAVFSSPIQCTARYGVEDRKSTRLNSSHVAISYAVFCLKKKTQTRIK